MALNIIEKKYYKSELLAFELKSVNKLINQNLISMSPACNKLISYFRTNCGKMIRPKLLLLSGGVCGKITQDHILSAAIFQLIHDATLLHDDVIDEGLLRRNIATVNSKWGNRVAVLTGDLLLSHAIKMCVELSNKAMSIIFDAIIKTCEGEINQDFNDIYENVSEQEYIRLIQMKSAEMFSQCCYLGGFLSSANETVCHHLRSYGLLVGTAYQISDDLEDICSYDSQLGKSSKRDIKSRIMTLPIIHYIQQGGNWRLLEHISQDQAVYELIKSGSLEYCRKKIDIFCSKAILHLRPLVDNEYKFLLKHTAELISSKSQIFLPNNKQTQKRRNTDERF